MVFKLAARTQPAGAPMEGIAIRGASSARNPTVGRLRRNALTATTASDSARVATVGTKTIDVWRHFVHKRWNPDAQFLNLEVRGIGLVVWSVGKLKASPVVNVGRRGTWETWASAARCARCDSEGSVCHFQACFKSEATGEFQVSILVDGLIDPRQGSNDLLG